MRYERCDDQLSSLCGGGASGSGAGVETGATVFFFGASFFAAGGGGAAAVRGAGGAVTAGGGDAGFGLVAADAAGSGVMMLTAGIDVELGKSPDMGFPVGIDGGRVPVAVAAGPGAPLVHIGEYRAISPS